MTLILTMGGNTIASGYCFDEAAKRYNVPVEVLHAISHVESRGHPTAVNRNRDGSYDIGHMQINSRWLPQLKRYGIEEHHLYDPCTNTHVGAWILAQNFYRMGYNWDAIGAYNAVSKDKRAIYAQKIAAAIYGRKN